jgi:Ca2+-binding RTX toxin-like protein
MLIEATTQTTEGHVYILSGDDDLHVGAGITIRSTTTDAVLAFTGTHTIAVDGTIIGQDECINTIGCDTAQTIIINAGAQLISGGDGMVTDADGVILDGVGSMMTNAGTITSYGSAASLFVRDAGTTTVSNSGVMTGQFAGVWHKFGSGTLVFTNSGIVESPNYAFLGGVSGDLVFNTGMLKGTVDLGGGDDVLFNRAGTVLGNIMGGEGNDRFVLGVTSEIIDGGSGFDTLDLSRAWSPVTIDLAAPENNGGKRVSDDSYTGIEGLLGSHRGDVLHGNDVGNLLAGNGGRDTLSGGDGNDTVEGGTRRDVLTGGEGNDAFVFRTAFGMRDTITDFTSGKDILQFEGSAFGYGGATGAVAADDFISGTTLTASDASDHFIFRTTDATLWFDADGAGDSTARLVADFADSVVLTAADLVLI